MLEGNLTIVMYHYIRDIKHSRFPEIKGLQIEQFIEQIKYIKKNYNIISGDELLGVLNSSEKLPPKAILLTFDDGYIDHYSYVFPILNREKIFGCFFPNAKCAYLNQVLDVNKIHFILASASDKKIIIDYIFNIINEYGSQFQIHNKDYFWNKFAVKSRFDPPEIVFIKRILQKELPEELRQFVINSLFERFVSSEEESFSRELYMSIDQIKYLRENGMYIGSHGYNHHWLNSLNKMEQKREIELSLEFLQKIGTKIDNWIFCYPYGAYNNSLLSILTSYGCKIGLTTKVGIAKFPDDNLLTLPRLDTNDLPKDGKF